MTITYFVANRRDSGSDPFGMEQLTTLATDDDEADLIRLGDHARSLGWAVWVCSKWESDTSGDERCPDGKDVYRHHKGGLMPVPPFR